VVLQQVFKSYPILLPVNNLQIFVLHTGKDTSAAGRENFYGIYLCSNIRRVCVRVCALLTPHLPKQLSIVSSIVLKQFAATFTSAMTTSCALGRPLSAAFIAKGSATSAR
jgi:hypothetical protein